MNKKVLGVLGAFALAIIGTLLLVGYVGRAEDRALEGEELVEVYVAKDSIGAGTQAADLVDAVQVEKVPEKVRPASAVTDLDELDGLVTSVDLGVGEPLVTSRFVAPQAFEVRPEGVSAPAGMVEVTISLDPQRAVGGLVAPGETVAVISSFDPFDADPGVVEVDGQVVALPVDVASQETIKSPNTSHLILHKVLVTSVQVDSARDRDTDDDDEAGPAAAPTGELLVTLAVSPADAERLVFTAEFGHIWLASETAEVPEDGTSVQTRGSVYTSTEPDQAQ